MGTPVLFIHGLWLHASSWNPWAQLFRDAGYEPQQAQTRGPLLLIASGKDHIVPESVTRATSSSTATPKPAPACAMR